MIKSKLEWYILNFICCLGLFVCFALCRHHDRKATILCFRVNDAFICACDASEPNEITQCKTLYDARSMSRQTNIVCLPGNEVRRRILQGRSRNIYINAPQWLFDNTPTICSVENLFLGLYISVLPTSEQVIACGPFEPGYWCMEAPQNDGAVTCLEESHDQTVGCSRKVYISLG